MRVHGSCDLTTAENINSISTCRQQQQYQNSNNLVKHTGHGDNPLQNKNVVTRIMNVLQNLVIKDISTLIYHEHTVSNSIQKVQEIHTIKSFTKI